MTYKIPTTDRGGARDNNRRKSFIGLPPKKTGQGVLITALINRQGGASNFAEFCRGMDPRLNFRPQEVSAWRRRYSGVALKYVFALADLLDCSPYALNFAVVTQAMGPGLSWEAAVRSCKISEEAVDYVLKFPVPKLKKQRKS